MSNSRDQHWMRLAIDEAKNGHGFVSPNPKVGAVLVLNDQLLASGYHHKFGDVHAETDCLNKLDIDLCGDEVLYVTLEPCVHEGKQPACAKMIVEKGIKNVVIGNLDPNPLAAGKGVDFLKEHNVKVTTDVLALDCCKLNEGFYKWVTQKRPYVIVKVAMNMSGQIAPLPKQRVCITGLKAKEEVYKLRSNVDAILVGKNTLMVDNPELAAKCKNGYEPLRIVLGDLSETSVGDFRFGRDENWDAISGNIGDVLTVLADRGVTKLLVEGGADVFEQCLTADVVDELWIFVNQSLPSYEFGVSAFKQLPDCLRKLKGWSLDQPKWFGDDLLIRYVNDQ